MKPYFYEGIFEKECYKQLAVMNGDELLGCSIIIKAKYREHPKHISVLLFDVTIHDKTKSEQRKDYVTIRISPRGYSYRLSHHYQAGDQALPYVPGREQTMFHFPEEALKGAAYGMFSFYKLNDNQGKWVPSKSFKE